MYMTQVRGVRRSCILINAELRMVKYSDSVTIMGNYTMNNWLYDTALYQIAQVQANKNDKKSVYFADNNRRSTRFFYVQKLVIFKASNLNSEV